VKRIAKWAAYTGSFLISCAMLYGLYILWPQFILHMTHTWLAFGFVIALIVVFGLPIFLLRRLVKRHQGNS
jgi:hypothetical protein